MSDSQWPRFEVFEQAKVGDPHRNIGSVHAPDAEMALINARDVFARRPECHNLWVVPASAIFAQTAEELAASDAWQMAISTPNLPAEPYAVFIKDSHRRSMTYVSHVGEVMAQSPVAALQKALTAFDGRSAMVWWVCPVRAITQNNDDDIASFFEPAIGKTYRLPNQYHTVFTMQKIRRAEEQEDEA